MNWKQIKENCPKAWELANRYEGEFFKRPIDQIYCHRNLYDFFDGQKVVVDIDHDLGLFEFYIDVNEEGNEGDGRIYATRIEAETAAFTKAFDLLEKQLNTVETSEKS